jgi:CRP-like cAMP-binding protein
VVHQFSSSIRARRQQFFGDGVERAAQMLLSFAEATDAEASPFRLSFATLARQLGCSRRNAIRIIAELEARKLIVPVDDAWQLDVVRLRQFVSTLVYSHRD